MASLNNRCSNCQMLEMKILEMNSCVKKLDTLKRKIIATDTLIRKYKEQKEEAEKLVADKQHLVEEREKCERLCTKYEVELKGALEDVHNLRQCEKDYKASVSRFQAEINTLRDSLEAEKALVKQYKSLVEEDDKTDENVKDKTVKDLEKKLSKKDDDLQRARERTRDVSKKLTQMARSHNKALKFIQKLGTLPDIQGILQVGERRTLSNFCEALKNGNSLLKTENGNMSEDEDNEVWDESQYLENLLMDSIPSEVKAENIESLSNEKVTDTPTPLTNGDCKAKHIQHAALDSTTDATHPKNGCQRGPTVETIPAKSVKETLLEKIGIPVVISDVQSEVKCDSPDSTSATVSHNIQCSLSMPLVPNGCSEKNTSNEPVDNANCRTEQPVNDVLEDTHLAEKTVDKGTVTDFPDNPDDFIDPDIVSDDSSNPMFRVNNCDLGNENHSMDVDTEETSVNENGSDCVLVATVLEPEVVSCDLLSDSRAAEDKTENGGEISPMEMEPSYEVSAKETVTVLSDHEFNVDSEVNHVMDHILNSASDLTCDLMDSDPGVCTVSAENACMENLTSSNADLIKKDDVNLSNAESEYEEGELVIATDDERAATKDELDSSGTVGIAVTNLTQVSKERNVTEDQSNEHRSTSDFTLPLIPFSEDRKFQPAMKCASDHSSLFHTGNIELSNDNVDLTIARKKKSKKPKSTNSKLDRICSRMKTSIVLDAPVSPLPPSPPLSPTETECKKTFMPELLHAIEDVSHESQGYISELFGSDSEDESPSQLSKNILLHQESEGFEPDTEHQDVQSEETYRKQEIANKREAMRRAGRKARELEVLQSRESDRSFGHESYGQQTASSAVTQVNQQSYQCEVGSRLFTDFSMDPNSGRCKISIRLPDNLNSAASVRFELDTQSKQIHLDYGPSQFNSRGVCRQPRLTSNSNHSYNESGSSSPKVTLPDDSLIPCTPILSPPKCHAVEIENNSTSSDRIRSSFLQGKPARRASVPPVRPSLQRLAAQRRTVTFEDNEKEVSCNGSVETLGEAPTPFKTPPARKEITSILHKNTHNGTSQAVVNAVLNSTDETNSESQEAVMSQARNKANSCCTPNNASQLFENKDTNVPKSKKKLKRKNKSPQRSNDMPKKANSAPSDSPAQKNAQIFQATVPISLPTNPQVVKALKPLLKVKMNNENNNAIFTRLFKTLCNSSLCPTPDDLVTASLVFFSSCPVNILTFFPKKKDPLLTAKEEVFVSLVVHLKEKQAHLANIVNHFLTCSTVQLNKSLDACPTGLASLCRLHTVLCRQEGYLQISQDLCYHLVLRKHPHAAYLIANVLVVWPFVLEQGCSPAHWNLRKKIFSLFLMGSQGDTDDQTCRVLKDLGHLQFSEADCIPDSLASEMVDLLSLSDELRANEDVCQQLLLLAYMQGWLWTKDTVLPSIFSVFDSVTGKNKSPIIRLIGSFLHYCGPKTKEDSDFLLQKLEGKFKSLSDDVSDFELKEACTHSLLSLAGQLDSSTVSQMRSWLQSHKNRLSPHLQEDFISSGLLA